MFELFYSDGGHGGPYKSLKEAQDAAKRILLGRTSGNENLSIQIKTGSTSDAEVVDTIYLRDLKEQKTMEQTFNDFANELASIGNNRDKMGKFLDAFSNLHLTLQQRAVVAALALVIRMAEHGEKGLTDPRNAASVKVCSEIRAMLREKDYTYTTNGRETVPLPLI